MSAGEKAEKYVREQCPELMMLSFGCEVIAHKRLFTYLTPKLGGDDLVHVLDDRNAPNAICRVDITEIIGHPIQLQHWLRVLEGNEYHIYKRADYLQIAVGDVDMGLIDYSLVFNLTTGQPATEADYQAFLDILCLPSK